MKFDFAKKKKKIVSSMISDHPFPVFILFFQCPVQNDNLLKMRNSLIVYPVQGAKKIIFTACHSGKLKLAFTSPDVISTSPKSFLTSRIDFTVLIVRLPQTHHLPVGQVKNRIH